LSIILPVFLSSLSLKQLLFNSVRTRSFSATVLGDADKDPGGVMVRSLQGTKHTIDEKLEQSDIRLLRGGQAMRVDSRELDLESASDDDDDDSDGKERDLDDEEGDEAVEGVPDGSASESDEEMGEAEGLGVPGKGALANGVKKATGVNGKVKGGVNGLKRAAPKERKEAVEGGRVRRRAVFDDEGEVGEGIGGASESDDLDSELEGDVAGKRANAKEADEAGATSSDDSEEESDHEQAGPMDASSPEEEMGRSESEDEEASEEEAEVSKEEAQASEEEAESSGEEGNESEEEREEKRAGQQKQVVPSEKSVKSRKDGDKRGGESVVLPPPPPGGPSALLRSAEVERTGPSEDSDDESEDQMEGTSGAASQWKEGLFAKMTENFSKKVNLMELVYGRSKGLEKGAPQEEESSDEDNFFRPKKRGVQKAPERSSDELEDLDADDTARLVSDGAALEEFEDPEVLEGLRDRFVTGDWEKAEKRRKGELSDEEPDEENEGSDEEVFGDFEDLETGEKVIGAADVVKEGLENEDPEAEGRRLKKLALRAKFDAKYSGVEGDEEEEEGEEGGGGKGPSGRPEKGYMQKARDAAMDDHHVLVKKEMEERRLRNQAELAELDPETRVRMVAQSLS
jgi:hypothetical protein